MDLRHAKIDATVGGNYVLTLRMIEGEEPIRFVASNESEPRERYAM